MFSWYLTAELSPKLLLYIFQVIAIKTCEASRTHSGTLWTSIYLFISFPPLPFFSKFFAVFSVAHDMLLHLWQGTFARSPSDSECLILLASFKFSAVYVKLPITYYLFFVSLSFQGPIYHLILVSFLCVLFPLILFVSSYKIHLHQDSIISSIISFVLSSSLVWSQFTAWLQL